MSETNTPHCVYVSALFQAAYDDHIMKFMYDRFDTETLDITHENMKFSQTAIVVKSSLTLLDHMFLFTFTKSSLKSSDQIAGLSHLPRTVDGNVFCYSLKFKENPSSQIAFADNSARHVRETALVMENVFLLSQLCAELFSYR